MRNALKSTERSQPQGRGRGVGRGLVEVGPLSAQDLHHLDETFGRGEVQGCGIDILGPKGIVSDEFQGVSVVFIAAVVVSSPFRDTSWLLGVFSACFRCNFARALGGRLREYVT